MKKEFVVSGKQFYIHEAMPLVSGDANCYELVFYAPCNLEDSVFTVTATRPDGEIFTAMGEVSGKKARYVLDNSMYAVAGPLKVRTVITAADGSVITANEITFEVIEGTNNDSAVEADTNYPVLTQLILRFEDMMAGVPAVKEVIDKAEETISDAETKAIFAASSAEKAESAAKKAESVADKAEWFMQKVDGIREALPPPFTVDDEGKFLFLSRNGTVSEIASVSGSYTKDDNIITDAGLLDEETAFIDISAAEIYDLGISNPLDERCAYAFQLMPDSLDYTTDFDVMAESVEETDNGFRLIFPADHCEPFAANNIQSASDLFAFFETVQLNAEYPKACVTPTWGTEEEILSPAYLDECIISPAVSLANRYTDEKTSFTVTVRESAFGQGTSIDLEGISGGVKRLEITLKSDILDNPSSFMLYFIPDDGGIETFAGGYTLPESLKAGDKIVFDAEKEISVVYPAETPDAPYSLEDADEFLYALRHGIFNRIHLNDMQCMSHFCETEYFVSADYVIDDKIRTAVIDSWEVAV